jgi:hypothetical protein
MFYARVRADKAGGVVNGLNRAIPAPLAHAVTEPSR